MSKCIILVLYGHVHERLCTFPLSFINWTQKGLQNLFTRSYSLYIQSALEQYQVLQVFNI